MTNEEAIGWLESLERLDKEQDVALAMAIEALQERKTGKWIVIDRDEKNEEDCAWECSECKNTLFGRVFIGRFKYCNKCGAKMEVDDGID